MSTVLDWRPLDARDALAAVEHDIRGVASTLGTIGSLLSDGRLPKAEEPALFERLTRLAARLEMIAAEAQLLSDWLDAGTSRTWQLKPIGPLLESVFGVLQSADPRDDDGGWRRDLVRVSEDGALERALRTFRDHTSRDSDAGPGWMAAAGEGVCDVFIGRGDLPRVEIRERFDVPRTASLVAALAVLTGHGVSVWRGRGREGAGLSIPMARPAAQS
ncbi:MAG TPA: hypothetical protein VFO19_14315 [Vicinamibacterales bacterium]|nr:hypothetical protein [Vicinamibacterales bacterium]